MAARPSRWQLIFAHLWLILEGSDAVVPREMLSLAKVSLIGLGVEHMMIRLVDRSRAIAWTHEFLPVIIGLVGLTALISSFLFVLTQAVCDLDQHELSGGALFGIGEAAICVCARGTTMVCSWEEVEIHESPLGFLFRLPWRAFQLVPRKSLGESELRALLPMVERAKRIRNDAERAASLRLR